MHPCPAPTHHALPPPARTPSQAWVGPSSVLVGTKCNSLLLLDALSGAHRRVPLPPKPAVRLGPDLMHNPDGHCGMHALDVSPGGRYVVTGGAAAEDAVVWRRELLAPLQTFSVRIRVGWLVGWLVGVGGREAEVESVGWAGD
jgi:hypothetical protein